MKSLSATILAVAVVLSCASDAGAREPVPVIVSFQGSGKVRVQIADGAIKPCDSIDNRMIYEGWMSPGDRIETAVVGSECACVRHTSVKFPNTDWSISTSYCRPRFCRNRVCRPAPDPTIRVQLASF